MLIPNSLRREMLEGLHAAHQGITGMSEHARGRFFWPGINAAIKQTRNHCQTCNENAPSQAHEPLIITPLPEVPFQQVVTDMYSVSSNDFFIYADRYSGWIEVAKLQTKTWHSLRECFLRWFATFGVPEEFSSDGGPPFNSSSYTEFLKKWDIRRRQSSAHYAHSNERAEAAVKSAKRILMGNIDPLTGRLDTDEAVRALLTHRNTPTKGTGIPPSVALFGHQIRDHLPNQKLQLRQEWQDIMNAREGALAKVHIASKHDINHTLKPLQAGQAVQVQSQIGNKPLKWSNTGIIVDVLPYRQYKVVMDGSRRVTLRNRRFLRSIDPVSRRDQYSPMPVTPEKEVHSSEGDTHAQSHTQALPRMNDIIPSVEEPFSDRSEDINNMHIPPVIPPTQLTEHSSSTETNDQGEVQPARRSTRIRKAPQRLSIDPSLKSYT